MTEGDISRNIRSALALVGIPCERVQAGMVKVRGARMHLASTGTPDLVTPYGWLEIKVPGREPEPPQQSWANQWREHGVNVGCAHSVAEAVALVLGWRLDAQHPLQRDCDRCLNGGVK